jgi:hypothetical protein
MGKTLRYAAASAALISMFGMAGVALAANTLTCFSGTTDGGIYGGTCTINPNGSATLSNNSANPNGDYSGVNFTNSTLVGQSLGSVTQLGYTYSGTTVPTPGDLSLNFLVGPGNTDYAYVDAFYCPGTAGVVDVVHDANCGIWYQGLEYPNWAAFVAAFPGATIGGTPFIVAERTPAEGPAVWTVSNLQLGGPSVAANKDQCKNNGWQNIVRADGSSFKNQGDCIQYANNGK